MTLMFKNKQNSFPTDSEEREGYQESLFTAFVGIIDGQNLSVNMKAQTTLWIKNQNFEKLHADPLLTEEIIQPHALFPKFQVFTHCLLDVEYCNPD